MVTRRRGNAGIAGEQWGAQHLRERHVHRIVRCKCRAEFPNAWKEEIVWIAIQRKVTKILERFFPPKLANGLLPDITTQHLGYFDIE